MRFVVCEGCILPQERGSMPVSMLGALFRECALEHSALVCVVLAGLLRPALSQLYVVPFQIHNSTARACISRHTCFDSISSLLVMAVPTSYRESGSRSY
jgi:hypothetical protein